MQNYKEPITTILLQGSMCFAQKFKLTITELIQDVAVSKKHTYTIFYFIHAYNKMQRLWL